MKDPEKLTNFKKKQSLRKTLSIIVRIVVKIVAAVLQDFLSQKIAPKKNQGLLFTPITSVSVIE